VGVRAGDDSPSKRDRQPSLCAAALCARCKAAAFPLKRGNTKAQVPPPATHRGDCPCRREPTKHRHGDNLVSAQNNGNCSVSVYCSVAFVNLQCVASIAEYRVIAQS
jgi:hypothetical protein